MLCSDLERWDGEYGGREVQREEIYVYICIYFLFFSFAILLPNLKENKD